MTDPGQPPGAREAAPLTRILRDKLSGIRVTQELLDALTDDEYAQLIGEIDKLRQAQATRRYADYVEYVHRGMWKPARHLLYVCDQIEAFLSAQTGHPYDILLLSMPPQCGKSMTVTETLPSWYLGEKPAAPGHHRRVRGGICPQVRAAQP